MTEVFPLKVQDIQGMMGVETCEIMEKNLLWIECYSYLSRIYKYQGQAYQPRHLDLIKLDTTEGLFAFPMRTNWRTDALEGVWIVRPCANPKVYGEVLKLRERQYPMLIMMDDATGNCVLELGIRSRPDDDPNMRVYHHIHLKWNPKGFETLYLPPEDDGPPPTIIHGKPRRGIGQGRGYEPKNVGRRWRKDGR